MAVLLLYTLQLAVNTVKAFLSPRPPTPCMSLFLSLCSQVHRFPRWLPQLWPHPERVGVVAGPEKVPALNTRSRAQQPLFAMGSPPPC